MALKIRKEKVKCMPMGSIQVCTYTKEYGYKSLDYEYEWKRCNC